MNDSNLGADAPTAAALEAKLESARALLRGEGSALVAFSAGVDSTLVLKLAVEALGDRVLAVTGRSPAVPGAEQEEAIRLAREIGAKHRFLDTAELESPGYVANGPDRCYHCKTELFGRLERVRVESDLAVVVDGTNADDLGDHRPGWRARRENRVLSPLVEAGFRKDDVRAGSKRYGLPTAEKPAMACLASRIPYGTSVTPEALARIERAEAALRELGFSSFRVRHHGEVARLEVAPEEMERMNDAALRGEVAARLKAAGYAWAALDLEGYRSGSLNETLITRIVPAEEARRSSGSGASVDPSSGLR